MFDGLVLLHPALEAAIKMGDMRVAHLLERRGTERGSSTACAMQDDSLIRVQGIVMVRAGGIRTKFQHSTRDMYRTRNLAVFLNLGAVPKVNDDSPTFLLLRHLRRVEVLYSAFGFSHHVFCGLCHGVLPLVTLVALAQANSKVNPTPVRSCSIGQRLHPETGMVGVYW